ncbi:MAG: NAD-dependent protein deacetylase [Longimicrobiales bacterium]
MNRAATGTVQPGVEHRDCDAWSRLLDVLAGRRIVVLAGAGCSTESGIPDYRGTGAPRRRAPVQYQEFVRDASARARYWARSTIGWPRMRAAQPNAGHRALARMEQTGHVAGLITQNVDGLHHAAHSRRVVELHGSLAAVRCIECRDVVSRDTFQDRLLELNSGWPPLARIDAIASAPDGDADLADAMLESFRVPVCGTCAGIMKPHVVFFGENVPAPVVQEAWSVFAEGDVLLVTGSSLAVYSGRRFIDRARRDGIPIAIINRGSTRADEVAAAKIDGALGTVLPALADALPPVGRSDHSDQSAARPALSAL